jgi:hypothetical protein
MQRKVGEKSGKINGKMNGEQDSFGAIFSLPQDKKRQS